MKTGEVIDGWAIHKLPLDGTHYATCLGGRGELYLFHGNPVVDGTWEKPSDRVIDRLRQLESEWKGRCLDLTNPEVQHETQG